MSTVFCPSCGTAMSADAVACPACGRPGPTQPAPPGTAATVPIAEAPVPVRLGRAMGAKFEVRRLIGAGGFAEVYEVLDRELDRRLAVKVLRPDIAWTAGMLARFKDEARAIARLQHPNILPIHFVGEGEGLVYYAMPFVDGESLTDLLKREGALEPGRALALAVPILEALGHAHAQGLVHRDIKPDNIMIERGTQRPLLVDFGIAKQLDSGKPGHTQAGFVVGTPTYMSPEQALGQPNLDQRTDLYAFGAVLFQMVTGAPPYDGDSSQEVVGKHLTAPIPTPTDRNARVPVWLSAVVVRCLAKDARDRYQSAAQVVEALRAGGAGNAEATVSAASLAREVRRVSQAPGTPAVPQPTAPPAPAVAAAGVVTGAAPSAPKVRPPASPPPPAPAPPPQPSAPSEAATVTLAAPRRRGVIPLIVVLVVAVGGFLGFAWMTRPTLVLRNRLNVPIAVFVNTEPERRVAAGDSIVTAVRRSGPLTVHWYPMGVTQEDDPSKQEFQRNVTVPTPKGRTVVEATAATEAPEFFQPLVTNAAGQPLTLRVNVGSAAARDCGCTVPPGATRQPVGFYRLYANSSVRAVLPDGREATFTDLGGQVDRVTGIVRLRFNAGDFRTPGALQARVTP